MRTFHNYSPVLGGIADILIWLTAFRIPLSAHKPHVLRSGPGLTEGPLQDVNTIFVSDVYLLKDNFAFIIVVYKQAFFGENE